MLSSDTARMGESSLLSQMSKQMKRKFPTKYVVRIDINYHNDELNTLHQKHTDKEKAIEFLSQKLLKFQHSVRLELFKQCCELKQKEWLVIILDGFYEIIPLYKQTLLTL